MGIRVASASVSAGGSGTPSVSAGQYGTPAEIEVVVTANRERTASSENLDDAAGRRVRLRPKPDGRAISQIYGSAEGGGLMRPLIDTKGMVFPYQPVITYQQEVLYSQMEMVHTNQDIYSYVRTPALKLTVDGEFTCQNQEEGRYSLACVHFLRTVTKMWFGGESETSIAKQGTPPPVLLFDAYGQYMFNNLPVIVTQFSVTLPKEVDYFPVEVSNSDEGAPRAADLYSSIFRPNASRLNMNGNTGYAWLPVQFGISVQLTVQNTPRRLRSFDMTKFSTGELLKKGGWV